MRTGQPLTFASHTASIARIAHLRRPRFASRVVTEFAWPGPSPQKHVTAFSARARDCAEHRAPPAYFPDVAVRVGLANAIRARFRVHLANRFTRHSFCSSAGHRLENSSWTERRWILQIAWLRYAVEEFYGRWAICAPLGWRTQRSESPAREAGARRAQRD